MTFSMLAIISGNCDQSIISGTFVNLPVTTSSNHPISFHVSVRQEETAGQDKNESSTPSFKAT